MAGFSRIWKVIMIWWITANSFVISPPRNKQYLLQKKVAFIPRNEREFMEQTKFLKCAHSEGDKLYPTYVINPFHNETSLGCFPETHVTVKKCLEYNEKNDEIFIQPSILARCDNFSLTPCKGNYSSTKSYELFQCFEKYGGILSPMKKQRLIDQLMERVTERNQETNNLTSILTNGTVCQKENTNSHCDKVGLYVGCAFIILCGLFIIGILIIPMGIQMFRNEVKCGDFWKFWLGTLKTLYSSRTTDKIQDSLSGQVSSTDDASEKMELTTDDMDNINIRNEDE